MLNVALVSGDELLAFHIIMAATNESYVMLRCVEGRLKQS